MIFGGIKMFEKNDRVLLVARIIISFAIFIFAVASLVLGIVLSVVMESGALFLVAFAGWFICLLMSVFSKLLLSYFCDIKLIRNKLYGESNEKLKVFLKSADEDSDNPDSQNKQ